MSQTDESTEVIDQAAAVLRAHERFGMKHCGCSEWAGVDPDATHSEHVARALAREGLFDPAPAHPGVAALLARCDELDARAAAGSFLLLRTSEVRALLDTDTTSEGGQ